MNKNQIEKIVEEATREILNGDVDFLQQCLGLSYYLEIFSTKNGQHQNNPLSSKSEELDYKQFNCPFFKQYNYADSEAIQKEILNKLVSWSTKKELTFKQAFRLVVVHDYLCYNLSYRINLPTESPKIRFAQHYIGLIDLYDLRDLQEACEMFGLIHE